MLLLLRQDAGQVRAVQATLSLGGIPGAPVREVLVAVRLKLPPTESANLDICNVGKPFKIRGEQKKLGRQGAVLQDSGAQRVTNTTRRVLQSCTLLT